MTSILITAFGPYDRWQENASWLAMVELTRELPQGPQITTRRYPVSFKEVRELLAQDLKADYDFALYLGQAPGTASIHLEAIGINVGGHSGQLPEEFGLLVEDGPTAYRSSLPLRTWATELRESGIPAQVSYHAGTYLCNATLYWSHYLAEKMSLKTRSAFVHLPLDVTQVLDEPREVASLSAATVADALRHLVAKLAALAPAD